MASLHVPSLSFMFIAKLQNKITNLLLMAIRFSQHMRTYIFRHL